MEFLSALSGNVIYVLIFLALCLCGLGIPLPEELTLVTAGYLTYEGEVNLFTMWVLCIVAITFGDSLLFFIGRKWGKKLGSHPKIAKFWHLERQEKVKTYFKKAGIRTIFIVRFLSGLRGPVHMLAGSSGFSFPKYLITNFIAVIIHVTVVAGLGYVFGNHIDVVRHNVEIAKHILIAVIIVVIIVAFLKYSYSKSKQFPK
ncbi:MAG: hypothetical protein A3H42_03125 [Deltaproteobacteria bacterium RIFCSPLOWO2_02_FULL_46_8]|nr:MAG: hypothetical protein A3H42_03125 [Deltaproteobacteria bacterium RIFCSPLOWO2_02_FULL_46_8]